MIDSNTYWTCLCGKLGVGAACECGQRFEDIYTTAEQEGSPFPVRFKTLTFVLPSPLDGECRGCPIAKACRWATRESAPLPFRSKQFPGPGCPWFAAKDIVK